MPREALGLRSEGTTVVVAAALGSYLYLVALGVTWWVMNLGAVPAYGDTRQYFELADSLRVDQYRTLFYPLLLRGLRTLAGALHARVELLVYAVQTIAVLLSVAYLGRALWDVTANAQLFAVLAGAAAIVRRVAIGAFALVVFTEPLVNHFALSVMTDSLAASFTTAGIAALVRIVVLADTRLGTCLVGGLTIAGAGFMRAEKVAVFATVTAVTLAIVMVRGRRAASSGAASPRTQWLRTIAVLATLLLIPSAAILALNRATQTADNGWPAVTLNARLFVRTAWPRLTDLRPLLSPETQALVSAADANRFDAEYNEFLSLVPRLQRGAGGTDRFINEISFTALRHRGIDIAAATATDALRYTVPMIAYPIDLVAGTHTASRWTDSRMGMAHPTLTRVYLVVATAVLVAVQLPLVLLALARGAARDPRITLAACLILAPALVNGVFYALGNGLQNVRYGLPAYVLGYVLIVWANAALLAVLWGLPATRRPRIESR